MNVIIKNLPIILCGLLLILLVFIGWLMCRKGYKKQVFGTLYMLVCRAEAEIVGTKRGKERKAQVLAAIHEWMPGWMRIFITEKDLDNLLEAAVRKMKEMLKQASGGTV